MHAYLARSATLYIETGTADLASAQRVLMVASDRVSAFDHVLPPRHNR
jgi:phosphoribosylaminoimidazole-succinocarboxamide synthase